jgi:hypothetical protein
MKSRPRLCVGHGVKAPVTWSTSARRDRIKEEIAVDIPRPRSLDVLTAPEFTALKRRVLTLIREEAMRALAQAEPLGPRPQR